jgi:hypothetical protein
LQSIEANTLTVHTSNSPISGSGVNATTASLISSNGHLSGDYNITDTIVLHTTNSPITSSITLNHDGDSKPASAHLQTTNGRVESDFVLAAATESGWGGSFIVSAHSTNSPVSVSVKDSPADSTLSLIGKTSNGRASANLHRAFEGVFSAHTSNGRVTLSTPKVEDPRGEGRERIIEHLNWDKYRKSVTGSVHWGDDNKDEKKGSVVLQTSNSAIDLSL